ncbi:SAM-dependent methyltransferase [Actinomadura rayongensis]|uniref:SAM-dependent methyltransferase n=1 Tax=Actinomadura rayongensis TaxID=1429076 RepID=A0A6I4WEA0_9ACTN|nr:SAM-dependent methyltransferase [Actinomadura rayongensis]MXQ68051.1 SAM-dependent methyltransferase [Actinomadura rayongensis]
MAPEPPPPATAADRIDTTRPHSARVWDHWLGGKDNYKVDRELGDQVERTFPHVVAMARAGRAFMHRAVAHLARDAGIRQFLDIGTGMPTAPNVHEVAQGIAPESRVVYVDNDPAVLAHARALLTSTAPGSCAYLDGDLREPGRVLSLAGRSLDLDAPVAVLLISVLHFIGDDEDAVSIVGRLMDRLPPGSHLAITHATDEIGGPAVTAAMEAWNRTVVTPLRPRGRDAFTELFFTRLGLELVEPGVVSPPHWRPGASAAPHQPDVPYWVGVARKP